jgi:flagellar hook assembly protein FlgD
VLADKSQGNTGNLPPLSVAPNPFGSDTEISFQTSADGDVKLTVYDVSGARVRVLVDEQRPAAFYTVPWDGLNDQGDRVAKGVYFVDLHTTAGRTTARAVIVR